MCWERSGARSPRRSDRVPPMAKPARKNPAKKKPFKGRLDQLTELVEDLERGELDLEDAILKFEQGKNLHQELMDELGAYEKRLEKLVRGSDGEDDLDEVDEK